MATDKTTSEGNCTNILPIRIQWAGPTNAEVPEDQQFEMHTINQRNKAANFR